MTGQYRAAIIGCGGISHPHATAIGAVEGVELVAAADISQPTLQAFGARHGVDRIYTDAEEMLATEQPDLVVICTWPHTHADLTELSCAAGAKAVISEKPMAVDLTDADRMLHASTRSGTVLLVNHQRRFGWRYQEARRLIELGAIGQVTQISGTCNSEMLTSGTHVIDAIRFLAGDRPVTAVLGAIDMSPRSDILCFAPEFVRSGTFYGHHMESASTATLVFDDGMRAFAEAGTIARPGYVRIVVDGTEGRIEVAGDPPGVPGPPLRYLSAKENGWVEPQAPGPRPSEMALSLEALLRTLKTGEFHPLNGSSGRADLEIITAIYKSARARELVTLPLDCPTSPLEEMIREGEMPLNLPDGLRRFHALPTEADSEKAAEEVVRSLLETHAVLPGSWVDIERFTLDDYEEWYGEGLTKLQYEAVGQFLDALARERIMQD